MSASSLPDGSNVPESIRRLRAIDAEFFGTMYANAGIIGGDVEIRGDLIANDIYSEDWVSGGGTVPLALPDASATTGYALQSDTGVAQFAEVHADGGTLGDLTVTGFLQGGGYRAGAGSATAPAFTFTEDIESGMYREGLNQLGWTTAGIKRMALNSTRLLLVSPSIYVKDGGATTPGYTFTNYPNTGFYIYDTDQVGFTANGTVRIRMGTGNFFLESLVTDVRFRGVNSFATTGSDAGNLFCQTSGTIGQFKRYTSARKYKSHINYDMDHLADIELRPTKHYRKDDKRWFYSLIADDLGEQDKLLANYTDGEIESFDQNAVMTVMAAKINRLEKLAMELSK